VAGKWQPNKSLTVTRYPAYKGPRPHADGIVFDIYNNLDAAYTALQARQVDIIFIGPGQYAEAERDMPRDVVAFSAPSIDFLGFPLYNSYFRNKLVREAISLAIDRQAISTKLFAGLDTPATSLLPPAEAGAPANACPYCRYDPALARRLLAEGGGWKGPLVLWYPSGVGYDSVAQAIANEWGLNLGLKVTLDAQPYTALVADLAAKKVTNGVFFGHWGAFFPSMENTLANLFLPTGADYIETWYSNPEVTAAIQQGNGASSPAAAEAYYRQTEQTITSDFPVVPLFFDSYVFVHSPAVSHVIVDVNPLELSDVVVTRS
jgi:oligopeptide transport system substrate-binding protein